MLLDPDNTIPTWIGVVEWTLGAAASIVAWQLTVHARAKARVDARFTQVFKSIEKAKTEMDRKIEVSATKAEDRHEKTRDWAQETFMPVREYEIHRQNSEEKLDRIVEKVERIYDHFFGDNLPPRSR